MSEIYRDLLQQVTQPEALAKLSDQLGANSSAVGNAVQQALPAMLGALQNNASTSNGAAALFGALERDHNGGIMNQMMDVLSQGGSQFGGASMLGHIFGNRQAPVEAELSQRSGLNSGQMGQLLATLAPLVLGSLGKAKQQQNLDPTGLAAELGRQRQQAEDSIGGFGMLGKLIDQDGDGKIDENIVNMGKSVLGSLLGGRR